MDILCVISRLLDYPDEALYDAESDISTIILSAPIKEEYKDRLQAFLWERLDSNMLDWQSEYDGLFERGRSLGLWLFEHVHGESRDRGQAMVDLMDQYQQAGLEISQHELPDYIPLFLEFIATQGEENARGWLQDVEHVLALLQARLEKRESNYSVLFEILLSIAESEVNLGEVREIVGGEKRDDSKEALDKEWEEEEVTFGAESVKEGCDSTRKPSESQRADIDVPVHWVDFNEPASVAEAPQSKRNS
ncbi:nitrate reductase molybdenum cofactor assembly chaperone [Teredinibacter purpureus]|uniref:nitrate reductase molybdenum cofactor assembly chaperone n=1 Tax=Teredinibacter purpureus TaxID=2731756 RepID=UPI0005F82D05|nr:nitrate reductase molybdenum cofactor assembly chaperone [Teredinibacter purpureus]